MKSLATERMLTLLKDEAECNDVQPAVTAVENSMERDILVLRAIDTVRELVRSSGIVCDDFDPPELITYPVLWREASDELVWMFCYGPDGTALGDQLRDMPREQWADKVAQAEFRLTYGAYTQFLASDALISAEPVFSVINEGLDGYPDICDFDGRSLAPNKVRGAVNDLMLYASAVTVYVAAHGEHT